MKVHGLVAEKRGNGSVEQILRVLNGRVSQGAVNVLLTGREDGITEQQARDASTLLRLILRSLLEAWIDTGKTQAGEKPWERTFSREVLQDYIERNPPMVQFNGQGHPYLVLFPQVWDERKGISPFVENAANAMFSELQTSEVSSNDAQSLRRILPFAWDAAIALLLQLLDSPARTQLFRCDGCRAYFMRTRAPKKDTPIYHGSWCVRCKDKGGATRTKNSRERRMAEMLCWAVDAWVEWKQDRKHGEREEWVMRKVNAKLGRSRPPIAVNWVTRHKKEIEAEIEWRIHGTQKAR